MRILHWTESFWPRIGGAEVFVRLLARDQCVRGHNCLVVSDVADGLGPDDVVDGVPIRRFPFQATLARRDLGGVLSLCEQAKLCVRHFAPDIIHLHTTQPGSFFFLRTHRVLGTPSVFTTHDPLAPAAAHGALAQLLGAVERIAGVSSFMTNRVIEVLPATRPKVRLIVSGLPWPDRKPSPLPWNPPVVLAVGRLARPKGFDVLLKALPEARRAFPHVRLVVAGDGECRAELEALARHADLAGHVHFLGWVSPQDITDLVDRATMVVVPSRWEEPFGLVALEAMQMARPVVASRIGGLPDAVQHEVTGRLVPPEDPGALAAAMTAVLGDRVGATAIGQRGHQIARDTFDWTRCADRYEALYREVAR